MRLRIESRSSAKNFRAVFVFARNERLRSGHRVPVTLNVECAVAFQSQDVARRKFLNAAKER